MCQINNTIKHRSSTTPTQRWALRNSKDKAEILNDQFKLACTQGKEDDYPSMKSQNARE